MRSALSIVFVGLSGLALVACSGSGSDGPPFGGGGTGGTVADCSSLMNPPPGCDDVCPSGSDSECELGTFCLNGVCSAQCTATDGCGQGSTCSSRGRCVPDVGTGGMGGSGNTGGDGCRPISVTPTRSIPNVMFLVDQSGSMPWCLYADRCDPDRSADPPELSRWEAAHVAITGVVSGLDSIVRFGLTTYQSADGGSTPDECPIFDTQVDFAMGNFGAINMSYDAQFPGGEDTPTGDAIDVLVDTIGASPPLPTGPTIIVLATDGAPDSCENPDPNPTTQAENEAVNAAARAHGLDIDVFVLWVGVLADSGIEAHLQDVANAGVGNPPQDAPFWVGETADGLEIAFRDIISDSISCEIPINKPFNEFTLDQACNEGEVRLNETLLNCPSDWRVKDEPPYNVIELLGSACDTFKSGQVDFTAEFPCGTIIVE